MSGENDIFPRHEARKENGGGGHDEEGRGTRSMDARLQLGICSTLELNRFEYAKNSFLLSATLTFEDY